MLLGGESARHARHMSYMQRVLRLICTHELKQKASKNKRRAKTKGELERLLQAGRHSQTGLGHMISYDPILMQHPDRIKAGAHLLLQHSRNTARHAHPGGHMGAGRAGSLVHMDTAHIHNHYGLQSAGGSHEPAQLLVVEQSVA